MAKFVFKLYLSYSQLCVFNSSLSEPFNDWSDRNVSQGFAWRSGSVSFKALLEDGDHQINFFVNEPIPEITADIMRAFKVPFETSDGNIDVASISDSQSLEIPSGKYLLQVEFVVIQENQIPQINIRFNNGDSCFSILRADNEIFVDAELDLDAVPAS